MSDERMGFDTPNEGTASNSAQDAAEQNIVESTAEVISETVTTETPAGETKKEEAPSYSYETYSANAGTNDYANEYTNEYTHADAGSATGNGSYQYNGAEHE